MLLSKEETIMKVRPSVKPICEKCKIIKRHLSESQAQAEAGLSDPELFAQGLRASLESRVALIDM